MSTPTHPLPNLVHIPKGYRVPNTAGMELANLAMWHTLRIGQTGMLAAPPEPVTTSPVGSTPNPAATQRRVWLDEPPGAIPFDEQDSIVIPAPTSPPSDTTVLQFQVPHGTDGIIKWISNNVDNAFASSPFMDGSGSLIWKILINGRPVRNFGGITSQKGTIAQGRQISPIRIFSGDIVQYTIAQTTLAPPINARTVCSLTGYYFPSKGIS